MSVRKMLRRVSALLLLAILSSCVPTFALADNGFSAYVSSLSMEVYRDPYLGQLWGTLPQNTVVTVNAYAGEVAQITYNGRTGYAYVSDMRKAEVDETEEAGSAAKTTKKTRVYQEADLASRYVTVPKGMKVNVVAKSGNCARVERNGYIGYMYTGHLSGGTAEALPESEAAAPAAPSMTLEQAAASGKFSNEQLMFTFATKVMGYNTAAACALLGNCYFESNFSTAALSDGGSSYGLFQWHESRWSRMRTWCKNNGYDYLTIVGQLNFLQYELKAYYPAVDKYLRSVPNTAQGAYDAGYYFCVKYLVPANKESQGAKRGNRAKDTYWKKYAGAEA